MSRLNKRIAACVLTVCLTAIAFFSGGCTHHDPQYGVESPLTLPGVHRQIWAVAPAVNLSGENVDSLLQADLLFDQLQQVRGLTVIPVNRVAEIYASLKIDEVKSEDQAKTICELLGCDGLVIPTITLFDPYDPPKFGGTLTLFGNLPGVAKTASGKPLAASRTGNASGTDAVQPVDQSALPPELQSFPARGNFFQTVGMFDASAGSTRDALKFYASGRSDPMGPLGAKEYLISMDRYCSFAYWSLTRQMLDKIKRKLPEGDSVAASTDSR
jgi:hypothetical protein